MAPPPPVALLPMKEEAPETVTLLPDWAQMAPPLPPALLPVKEEAPEMVTLEEAVEIAPPPLEAVLFSKVPPDTLTGPLAKIAPPLRVALLPVNAAEPETVTVPLA